MTAATMIFLPSFALTKVGLIELERISRFLFEMSIGFKEVSETIKQYRSLLQLVNQTLNPHSCMLSVCDARLISFMPLMV